MQILLIDDDALLVGSLTAELLAEGFAVVATPSAVEALLLQSQLAPALIVLRVRPGDGFPLDLLQAVRRASLAAVIIVVGKGDEEARIRALELGADDYVWGAVSARELSARIRAILQHHDQHTAALPTRLSVGALTLDATTRTVHQAGALVLLTVTEFRLLHHLMAHADEVAPFATLLREVWGYEHPVASDVVRTTVYRLRQKLHDDPQGAHVLHAAPGIGLILRAEPALSDAAF